MTNDDAGDDQETETNADHSDTNANDVDADASDAPSLSDVVSGVAETVFGWFG